jgi:hypothetical protein
LGDPNRSLARDRYNRNSHAQNSRLGIGGYPQATSGAVQATGHSSKSCPKLE